MEILVFGANFVRIIQILIALNANLLAVFIVIYGFSDSEICAQASFQKIYGGTSDDLASHVIELPDGYLVSGSTRSYGSGNSDGLLVKITFDGSVAWQKTYGGGADEQFSAVVQTPDGGFLAFGEAYNFGSEILLVKTSYTGTVQWSKTLSSTGDDHTDGRFNIIKLPDGFIIAGIQNSVPWGHAGTFVARLTWMGELIWKKSYSDGLHVLTSQTIRGDTVFLGSYPVGSNNSGAKIVCLNAENGELISSTNITGGASAALPYIYNTYDGGFLLTGSIAVPGNTDTRSPWIVKWNAQSQMEWSRTLSTGPRLTHAQAIPLSDGGFAVLCGAEKEYAEADAWLMRLDADGTILWNWRFGGPQCDRLIHFIQTSDQGFIAVGHTESIGKGGSDIFIIKTTAEGTLARCCVFPAFSESSNLPAENQAAALPVSDSFGVFYNWGVQQKNAWLSVMDYCGETAPYQTIEIPLCQGETFWHNGQAFITPATLVEVYPGNQVSCDTIIRKNLVMLEWPKLAKQIHACEGDTLLIGGRIIWQSSEWQDTIPAAGCDTLVQYSVQFAPKPVIERESHLCLGATYWKNAASYVSDTIIYDILPALASGCDTILIQRLYFHPLPVRIDSFSACHGDFIEVMGDAFFRDTTISRILPANGTECDTTKIFHLRFFPWPEQYRDVDLCDGEGFFNQSAAIYKDTVFVDTLKAVLGGCDTIRHTSVRIKPKAAISKLLDIFPGDTIWLNQQPFSNSDTVVVIKPGKNEECDTLATYFICLNTTLSLNCPPNITVETSSIHDQYAVSSFLPVLASDCPEGTPQWIQFTGPVMGEWLWPGSYSIGFSASDSCANSDSCEFSVVVDRGPCDVKTVNCLKFELLSLKKDASGHKNYKIRFTNICEGRTLEYLAIGLPQGLAATLPKNNSVYISPAGRHYSVRNPNISPVHSIRFKPQGPGLEKGQSDIFEYTLPKQADPTFIYVYAKMNPDLDFIGAAHLNTFYCLEAPPGDGVNHRSSTQEADFSLKIYPNPSTGAFALESPQKVQRIDLLDSQGKKVHTYSTAAPDNTIFLAKPEETPLGLYYINILFENGESTLKPIYFGGW